MQDLVKAIEGLPKIVKFILNLFWGVLGNLYRLARSVAKKNAVGIVLACILLLCGGFFILWLIDLIFILIGNDIWWID